MKITKLLIIPAVLIVGCNSKIDQSSSDDIAGTYVMEKTYEVRHEATGEPVGMATLRDTIIITKISDGYEVKNRKWKKNEFDEEGWVKQEHDAIPTYFAKFETVTQTLNPAASGLISPIQVNIDESSILKGKANLRYKRLPQ